MYKCHICTNDDETLAPSVDCSRIDCNKSFHVSCVIARNRKFDRSYFIFLAKMVFYPDEERLRPGYFCVCKHHSAWDTDSMWSSLKSYILGRKELTDSITIDVDTLPLDIQKAVWKASQMSIFNPEDNKHHILATGENAQLSFKDVVGSKMDIPVSQWIPWDHDWEVYLFDLRFL